MPNRLTEIQIYCNEKGRGGVFWYIDKHVNIFMFISKYMMLFFSIGKV